MNMSSLNTFNQGYLYAERVLALLPTQDTLLSLQTELDERCSDEPYDLGMAAALSDFRRRMGW